jgi:uracil-DNA glycosylase
VPPVVTGLPVMSEIYLLGQAPGIHEGRLGRPFAYTAGKTLFRWFDRLDVDEDRFRQRVYMAAVLRCFPGKTRGGGDRVPGRREIERCREWIVAEHRLLEPKLVIPVGRLAIEQVIGSKLDGLDQMVGTVRRTDYLGRPVDVVALPHPSGLSTWYKKEPGKRLLGKALRLLAAHPSWKRTF